MDCQLGLASRLDHLEAVGKRFEGDRDLKLGQWRPDAAVNSGAEGHLPSCVARVMSKRSGSSSCRGSRSADREAEHDHAVLGDLDPVERDVLVGDADEA